MFMLWCVFCLLHSWFSAVPTFLIISVVMAHIARTCFSFPHVTLAHLFLVVSRHPSVFRLDVFPLSCARLSTCLRAFPSSPAFCSSAFFSSSVSALLLLSVPPSCFLASAPLPSSWLISQLRALGRPATMSHPPCIILLPVVDLCLSDHPWKLLPFTCHYAPALWLSKPWQLISFYILMKVLIASLHQKAKIYPINLVFCTCLAEKDCTHKSVISLTQSIFLVYNIEWIAVIIIMLNMTANS